MKKKKFLWASLLLSASILGACGATEDKANEKEEKPAAEEQATEQKAEESKEVASLVDPRLQEVPEDATCEMCNMEVYTKDEPMGMFSAQAIKADGSIAFYDDIGCLLNAEVAHNETNEKFVRDFNTLEWVKVEDATIVKTDLKSPMNWGYIYFADKADADKYIAENEGAKVEELQTIKDAALERRKQKMQQQQQEQQGNGNMNMNGPQDGTGAQNGMDNMNHEGHN